MNQEQAGLPKEVTEELSEAATRRAAGWRCLTQGFGEPTPELLDDSYLAALDQAVGWMDGGREKFRAGRQAIADFRREGSRDPVALLQELQTEYARLFSGSEPRLSPPHESRYRGREPSEGSPAVSGSSAEAVRKFYQGAGWSSAPSLEDSPDHAATECDFMCYLCRQEADAWRQGDNEKGKEYRMLEHRFLDEHLALWLADLCAEIQSATRCKFYWGLADFAGHYLSLETGADFYVSFTP